jgi:hypothetical protein
MYFKMTSEKTESQTGEVADFANLIKSIFGFRKKIILLGGIGLFFGVLIAFTTPKEYQSSSFVLLESEGASSSMGQFGALAGFAGINMGQFQNGQIALTPEIFPDVIQSRDFLGEIAKQEFQFVTKNDQESSLEEYYYQERPSNVVKKTLNFILSIPSIISSWFEAPPPLPENFSSQQVPQLDETSYLNLSNKELYAIGELKKRIEIEQKGNIFRLSVSMPEPLIAAYKAPC